MRAIPKPGERYRHFKGKEYQILAVATHTETRERVVVYQALYGDYSVWVRPLTMFLSEVDRKKYPDTDQLYRFEKIAEPSGAVETGTEPDEAEEEDFPPMTDDGQEEKPSEEPQIPEKGKKPMSPLLAEFLDAETPEQKLAVLRRMSGQVGQREITSIYMALDLIPVSGSIETQLDAIRKYISMQSHFDAPRMRRSGDDDGIRYGDGRKHYGSTDPNYDDGYYPDE